MRMRVRGSAGECGDQVFFGSFILSSFFFSFFRLICSHVVVVAVVVVVALFASFSLPLSPLSSPPPSLFPCLSFVCLEKVRNSRFSIASISPRPKDHCIKSVCWDGSLNEILIGTKGSEAYTLSTTTDGTDSGTTRFGSAELIFSGHYQNEVRGLAPHPTRPDVLATCGDDATLRVWKTETTDHQCLAVGELVGMARACAWKPGGQRIVVGLGGRVGNRAIRSKKKKRKKKSKDSSGGRSSPKKKNKRGGSSGSSSGGGQDDDDEEPDYEGHFMIFEIKQDMFDSGYR